MGKVVDKTKINNWVTGDTFIQKIKSNEFSEYTGKYLIYIHEEVECSLAEKRSKYFRVKLTHTKKLPRTKKDIEDAEYVKMRAVFPDAEQKNFYKDTYFEFPKADVYGFIYIYLFRIIFIRGSKLNEFKYIGNFDITKPTEEYVPFPNLLQEPNRIYRFAMDSCLENYRNYNLRQFFGYTKEGNKELHFRALHMFDIMNQIGNLVYEESERWKGREKEWLLSMGIDIEKEKKKRKKDTLTYVGPEEEKSIKKKKS